MESQIKFHRKKIILWNPKHGNANVLAFVPPFAENRQFVGLVESQ